MNTLMQTATCALTALVLAGVVPAADLTWTGSQDTDGFNEANWDLGAVPSISDVQDTVVINAGTIE